MAWQILTNRIGLIVVAQEAVVGHLHPADGAFLLPRPKLE